MEELTKKIQELESHIDAAMMALKYDELVSEIKQLEAESLKPEFWNDRQNSQAKMKRLSSLQSRVEPWTVLARGVKDLKEIVALNDDSLSAEAADNLKKLESDFNSVKTDLAFSSPYDDHNVIISIHAGAGGTDAQDWARMLLRMYTRWAEQNAASITLIDESVGEEAGIKSATLEIEMPFAYGKLKGEHGVHRLVRLSPFNSDNLRQTSFAKVDVLPKIDSPNEALIDENDLKIDVYRSGGHGGQSVNTTDSAVRVTHIPSGITVSIQNERSQLQNKETALTILRSRLAQLQLEQHKERLSEIKGPNQSAEWGNQIRSYVLHPYKQVKDTRTKYESNDPQSVLDGSLDDFITAFIEYNIGSN